MRTASASVVLLALAAAGCSGATTVGTPAGPGKSGGRLVVAITQPGSLDPARANDPAGDQVQSLLCEPLITRDPRTGDLTTKGLAAYWITTSKGGQLTVRLRKGLRFSDGSKLNANDVLASWSRASLVETASPSAGVFQKVKGYDTVHGLIETDDTAALTKLKGVAPLSDSSISISLTERDGPFVERLSHPITAITPRSADQNPRFGEQPVCVGPYVLGRPFRSGSTTLVLSRSPHYYQGNTAYDVGGQGYADSVEMRVFGSRAEAVAAFGSGAVDIAPVPNDLLTQTAPKGASVVQAPNGTVDYLGLPSGHSPYAAPAVRRAMSQAIDRTELARVAFHGGALPATGFVPPTAGGDFRPDACADSVPSTAAPLAALKATVSAATLGKPGLTLAYPDVDANAAVAQELRRQWKAGLGLSVELVPMTAKAFLQKATSAEGITGAFLEGWKGLSPGTDDYLAPLLSDEGTGTSNLAHYTNGALERDLKKAREAEGPDGRKLAYRALEDRACADLPLIPLVFREWSYLVRTSKLATSNSSWTEKATGLLDLRDVWIS